MERKQITQKFIESASKEESEDSIRKISSIIDSDEVSFEFLGNSKQIKVTLNDKYLLFSKNGLNDENRERYFAVKHFYNNYESWYLSFLEKNLTISDKEVTKIERSLRLLFQGIVEERFKATSIVRATTGWVNQDAGPEKGKCYYV